MNQSTETVTTKTHEPQPTLIQTILHAINTHIDKQVDEKVGFVMQAHSAVRYIDESFREEIKEIAMEKVQEHDEVIHHLTEDSVKEIVDDIITEQVRKEVRDIDISNQVHDAITDYDFDDKIDCFDFDDKMDEWKDKNDILDSDQVREMIDEVIEEKVMEVFEEKVMEVLKKLLEKLNGV